MHTGMWAVSGYHPRVNKHICWKSGYHDKSIPGAASVYHQMYIMQNSGMQHLAVPSCECSVYEGFLCLRCKKEIVVGKWIFNTSNVYASRTSRLKLHIFWYCCILFFYYCIFFIVAYFFFMLHKFVYCCYLFFIVACLFLSVFFLLLQAETYCCHRKVIVACKWPFWATVCMRGSASLHATQARSQVD